MITTSEKLTIEMAKCATELRSALEEVCESKNPKFMQMIDAFKQGKQIEISDKDACHALAQITVFNLLFSKLDNKDVDFYDVDDPIIDFMKSLQNSDDAFFKNVVTIINKLFDIFNDADFISIKEKMKKGGFCEAPSFECFKLTEDGLEKQAEISSSEASNESLKMYLYEHFYRAYAVESRQQEGVFYTPSPVIHFINRAIMSIIEKEFGDKALEDAHLLDFATGTGGFLKDVVARVLKQSTDKKATFEKIKTNFRGNEINPVSANIANLLINETIRGFGINEKVNLIEVKNTLEATK